MNTQEKIQQMQITEQNLQNLLLQKQAFQMELSETQMALEEIKRSGEEVFKIIGQLMIKTEKAKIVDELQNKEKILDLRLKSIEKQETSFIDKMEALKTEIMSQKKN